MSDTELKPCPFCGGQPKMAEFEGDVGGGDYQKIFDVWCENSQCNVKPRCNVRGEHGYRRPEDLDNSAARAKSVADWNRRAPDDVAMIAELAFIERVAKQKPEKPDYWSSCSQCEHNISDAEDLVEVRAAIAAAARGETK